MGIAFYDDDAVLIFKNNPVIPGPSSNSFKES